MRLFAIFFAFVMTATAHANDFSIRDADASSSDSYDSFQTGFDEWDRDGRRDDWDRDRRHPRYPDRGRESRQVINCSSWNQRYETCYVHGDIVNVRLDRQISKMSCREGYSWGWDRNRIWVDKGCRADFSVYVRDGRDGHDDRGRFGDTIECNSWNFSYSSCPTRGRIHSVYLERQTSDTMCVAGRNWGYDFNRIWVDKGCSGVFRVRYN